MTKTLSFFDRLIVFLLGLLLIVAGLIPVAEYWDIPYLVDAAEYIDRSRLVDLTYQDFYVTALTVGAIVSAILGLWIPVSYTHLTLPTNREV